MASSLARSTSLCLLVVCTSFACEEGSERSAVPFVIAGLVRSPSGGALAAVPDGTLVELVRLDASGDPGVVLQSSLTSAGAYSLSVGGVASSSNLAVVTGAAADRMRAFAAGSTADIDPFSEVTVELVLEHEATPGAFTQRERLDVEAALELLARVAGLVPTDEVATTVALFRNAAQAEPDLASFLFAAAEVGQTDQGTGDIGDYFPTHVGDTWGLSVAEAQDGSPLGSHVLERRTVGEVAGVWTLQERVPLVDSPPSTSSFLETSSGVVRVAGADPEGLFGATRSERLRYPLGAGRSWLDAEFTGVTLPFDLDGDQLPESVEGELVRRVAGFEEVELASETLAHCARVDVSGALLLHGTSAAPLHAASWTSSEWYAPGLGLVRRRSELAVPDFSLRRHQVEELGSRVIDGAGRGILPSQTLATELGPPNGCLGSLEMATDGTNFIVVTGR